jgi:hypothetical protein
MAAAGALGPVGIGFSGARRASGASIFIDSNHLEWDQSKTLKRQLRQPP